MEPLSEPTFVGIDLDGLAYNFGQLVKLVGSDRLIMAVVKADAYGHGAVPVSKKLQSLGCHLFAVSNCREGIELRQGGISRPILLLGGIGPEESGTVIQYNLTPAIFDLAGAAALNGEAQKRAGRVKIHLKLDTGMGRLGITPSDLVPFLNRLKECEYLEMEGLFTHLADADREDKGFIEEQLVLLEKALPEINRLGFFPALVHMANSAAIIDYPPTLKGVVRPGIMIYGIHPSLYMKGKVELKPVMSLVSRISFLKKVLRGTPVGYGRSFVTQRESLIASVPVGYAHGYLRALSNRAQVLLKGKRARVVGRICMDWTMVDVTEIEGVKTGDEVVLLGGDVTPWELAELAGTIPYEIVCSIGARSRRVYFQEGGNLPGNEE